MKMVTPPFRASYPNLFKPKLNKLNNKQEYSVVALFKKGEDLKALRKAIEDVATEKFGPKAKWPKTLRMPLRDQAEKAKEDEGTGQMVLPDGHEEGAFFLNLKSNLPPSIVNQQKDDIIDTAEIYPGVWLRAQVNVYAYDQAGNKGVSVGLVHIQKVKDGESLGGGRGHVKDAFDVIETDDNDDFLK